MEYLNYHKEIRNLYLKENSDLKTEYVELCNKIKNQEKVKKKEKEGIITKEKREKKQNISYKSVNPNEYDEFDEFDEFDEIEEEGDNFDEKMILDKIKSIVKKNHSRGGISMEKIAEKLSETIDNIEPLINRLLLNTELKETMGGKILIQL